VRSVHDPLPPAIDWVTVLASSFQPTHARSSDPAVVVEPHARTCDVAFALDAYDAIWARAIAI
jgi:hypothetical protein